MAEPASPAKAGCLSGPAGGITSLVIIPEIETSKLNIRLQSTVSLSIQARSTDYSKMSSKSAAATNSFIVLNEPTIDNWTGGMIISTNLIC